VNKTAYITILIISLLAMAAPATGRSDTPIEDSASPASRASSQSETEVDAMLEEAEGLRVEALKAAEHAREASAQRQLELEEAQALKLKDITLQKKELASARTRQLEEKARQREELSRLHSELREASREVARAHRELAMEGQQHRIHVRNTNLGDRVVIGVILGDKTREGVRIMGVSPDGPAERAGLQPNDIMISIAGVDLGRAANGQAGGSVFEVMNEAEAGEELAVSVIRDGEKWDYMVTAEKREPRSLQSLIRIVERPESPTGLEDVELLIERIIVPEITEAALAVQLEKLQESVHSMSYRLIGGYGENPISHDVHLELMKMSDFGQHAIMEADIWFGLPHTQGLELTEINEDLGAYFKTDRGVLVIKAKEANAYTLLSGDVILEIGSTAVNTPADFMRALRDLSPGNEVTISIKRNRKNKTLTVAMPDKRLGFQYSINGLHGFDAHPE